MQIQSLRLRAFAFAAGVAVLAASGWANADPPSRVARLGFTSGPVSFSPAGEDDWVQATINRPVTTGDRFWSDAGARAEIQVGGAMIRMSAGTSVVVLNLDDRIAQLQLTQGILNVHVRRLDPNQVFEIDTPNLAFTLRQPGDYRIAVDADGNATDIVVRRGQGEVYGEGASYVIDSRQPYRFTGTGLLDYQQLAAPGPDEFDRWSSDRDRSYDSSVSARYVSPDVVGYQDLDANGTWRVDAAYGNVWVPSRVAAGWAPYQDGHWAWVDPWGWTWVDDAPWGYAVSHYGRWTNMSGTWGWVPGPVRSQAYYAPALVAFIGGNTFQITIASGNVGGIAWFPLGPRDVYQPSYSVSRGYFENINRSNTVINNTVINNYYNNTNVTNVVYVNQQVPGAIVAVPTTAFVQSQPVGRSAVRVTREMVASAPVAAVAVVAPTEKSVRGAAAQGDKPPARVFERPVVARTAPPAAPAGFAAQRQQLEAKPGKPLEENVRKELKSAAAAPAPVVKVVAQPKAGAPAALPPPAATAGRAPDGRGKSDERKGAPTPATAGAPVAPTTQGSAPARVAQPAAVAQPPEPRGKTEQRGKGEQREQTVTSPPAAAAPVAQTPVASPVPVPQPPPQRSAQPKVATPPQGASPASAAQQPPAPAKSEAAAVTRRPEAPAKAEPAPVARRPEAPPKAEAAAVTKRPEAPPKAEPAAAAKRPPEPSAKSEPAAVAKRPERGPPDAAAKPVPPQAQSAPKADTPNQEPKAAAGKARDKKKDSDEQKAEEESRKPKG